ncbi:monovalent cation/H+ antiporter subunit A [Marinobacteraceae bacterium S3BR75-40.1]
MTLLFVVLLPFVGAILPPLTRPLGRSACAFATALPPLMGLYLIAPSIEDVLTGEMLQQSLAWMPSLGLNLSLRLDGLSLLFTLLILSIGLLVILYARYYLSAKEAMGRFYALLLLFMGSMLGVVLSDNLLLMLVFWELTSLSSFLLIGYWSDKADARRGARMALAITGGGGLALMGGILLLGHMAGSYQLSVVLSSGDIIRDHPFYPVMLVLVLLGAFTKSAQFPFHFWLPHAMSAPTPVSAYLHSATMVKAGVFLLARLYPALSGTDLWFYLVTFTGAATFLVGAYLALYKHDLKGLLAYSTISHLGLIVLLFGLDTRLAAVAGVFHIINHATFKASLFMAAGIIDHETGTRDMRRINGLWRFMPHTAALAIVAALSMAGVPLLNGFLSKEMFFAETLETQLLGGLSGLLPILATLGGVFSVAYSVRFIHDVFFNGKPVDLPKYPPHEPPRYMKIPVEILVAVCLLVGIFPGFAVGELLASAARATLGGVLPDYKLAVMHGFNIPLLMSMTALLGGLAIYAVRRKLFELHDRWPDVDEKEIFERAIQGLRRAAGALVHTLSNGSLQRYMLLLILSALVALGYGLLRLPQLQGPVALAPVDNVAVVGGLMLVVAAVATVVSHHRRLVSLLMLGVVGLLVSLTFARFSAPDLALTQLSVEVVTIVLLMLALYFLPQRTPWESTPSRRIGHATIAGLTGLGVGALCFAFLTRPHDPISAFFLENSLSEGGGANVVNVILVDFRGFDTLGEITVLGIAALGVFAMLDGLRITAPRADATGHAWSTDMYPTLLQVTSRPLLPMALMVAFYILLRGHQLPGGGFIAGLVTAVALILQYVASGVNWSQERMRIAYRPLIGAGLAIATLTGMGSWWLDHPFLTSWHGHWHIPLIGDVEFATAMLFDIGVYLTVVGATLLILAKLGRASTADQKFAEAN